MTHHLAIDVGALAARAGVFDSHGQIRATSSSCFMRTAPI